MFGPASAAADRCGSYGARSPLALASRAGFWHCHREIRECDATELPARGERLIACHGRRSNGRARPAARIELQRILQDVEREVRSLVLVEHEHVGRLQHHNNKRLCSPPESRLTFILMCRCETEAFDSRSGSREPRKSTASGQARSPARWRIERVALLLEHFHM